MRGILTVAAAAALLGTVASPAGVAQAQGLGTSGFDTSPPAPPAADPSSEVMDEAGHRLPATFEAAVPERAPTADGPADWSMLGPPGGDVYDVAVSPVDSELALAGIAPGGSSGGTLYRSTDGGDTWTEVPDLSGTSVTGIEFTPDGRVFLATPSGVWTGDETGQNWTSHNLGIGANQQVKGLTIDPSDSDTVWAGIGEALGLQPVNLMRSTDGGVTWQNMTPPLAAPMTGQAIAVHPDDSNTVVATFAGFMSDGAVWVTTDGGATWHNRTPGLPYVAMNAAVFTGDRLLVGGGMRFGSQYAGIYESYDLGVTWTPLHDDSWTMPVVEGIAVDPADGDTILVATDGTGVHRSTDGGDTWEIGVGGSGALSTRSIRFSPGSSSEVFVGVSSLAVYRSTDGGDSFASSSEGIAELHLTSVTANPLDPAELAVSFRGQNDGGVLTSADAGASWRVEDVPPTRYSKVEFSPDGILYAVSDGPTSVAPEGLYRRHGDGSWESIGPDEGPVFETQLTNVTFSTENPDLIVAGGNDFGVAGNEATIWHTDDGGQTWTKAYEARPNDSVTDLEIVADGTDQTMVATVSSTSVAGGVLRSTDGGLTWTDSSSGLPTDYFRDQRMCASPTNPETLFLSGWTAFSAGGLFRSDDAGASWSSTGWAGDRIYDVACDPVDDQVLYLAQSGEAVLRSDDQGATFASFAAGLEDAATPSGFAFAGESHLLLATRSGSYVTQLREVPDPDPVPVVCDTTITGVHVGALDVTEGVTCLAAGAHVLGEVNVSAGAGLVATAAVVQGPVSALGASVLELAFTQVTGPVLASGGNGSVWLFGNQVTGSVTLVSNVTDGDIAVSGNTVIGSLTCFGNDPAPSNLGLPNTATAGAFGQCEGL